MSKEQRIEYIAECNQLLEELRALVQLAIDDINQEEQNADYQGYSSRLIGLSEHWDAEKQELDYILQTLWSIDFGSRYE